MFIISLFQESSANTPSNGEGIPKDQFSVPNLARLQKSSSIDEDVPPPSVTAINKVLLQKMDKSDGGDSSTNTGTTDSGYGDELSPSSSIKPSDSSYTFQSYDCSSSRSRYE